MGIDMWRMTAKQLQADCLKVLDQIHTTGDELLVTNDDDTPLVKLIPASAAEDEVFSSMRGKGKIVGDTINTIPIEDWDLGDSTNISKAKGPAPRRPSNR